MRKNVYLYRAGQNIDYDKVARSLVYEIDISLIDPALYQHMIYYIKVLMGKMQNAHEFYAVDKLNFALEYIEKYPERQRIHDMLVRPEKPPPVIKMPFEDDEVKEEIEKMINGEYNEDYTIEEIDQLLREVRHYQNDMAAEDRFMDADVYMNVYHNLCELRENIQVSKITNSQLKDAYDKLRDLKRQKKDLEQRYDKLLLNFDKHRQKTLEDMNNQMVKDREKIEKQFNDPVPSQFRKYSPKLMRMRQKEMMLSSSKRYIEAQAQHERVLQQQQIEDEQHKINWFEKIDRKLKEFERKFSIQSETRKRHMDAEEEEIKESKVKEIETLEQKIKYQQDLINEMKKMKQAAPPPDPSKVNKRTSSKSEMQKSSKLPPLETPDDSIGRKSSMTFRQRAILNTKIYNGKVLLAKPQKTNQAPK